MADLIGLSPEERARRYRQLAEEAEVAAHTVCDPLSDSYFRIARQWRELAEEIESGLVGKTDTRALSKLLGLISL